MAEQRLSKLQKWILSRCMEKVFIRRNEAREFYGKKFPFGEKACSYYGAIDRGVIKKDFELYNETKEVRKLFDYKVSGFKDTEYTILTPKAEYVSTKAEEVAISKSFKNLEGKGFITRAGNWGPWQLTEKGFLIAKKSATPCNFVNFKDYYGKIEQSKAENKKRLSEIEAAFRGVSRKDEPPEKAEKRREFRFKVLQFQNTFTPHAIFGLCCESCKKKICEFEIQCGCEEIKKLEEELETS